MNKSRTSCKQVINKSWTSWWTSHEQFMNKLWTSCKQVVKISLTSHEQVINKTWTSCKQVINKSWTSWWTSHEQVMNKSARWPSELRIMLSQPSCHIPYYVSHPMPKSVWITLYWMHLFMWNRWKKPIFLSFNQIRIWQIHSQHHKQLKYSCI